MISDISEPCETKVLTQLVTLLWEKTVNLEKIQHTYEEDCSILKERLASSEGEIISMQEEISRLSRILQSSTADAEIMPIYGSQVTACSAEPHGPAEDCSRKTVLEKQQTVEETVEESILSANHNTAVVPRDLPSNTVDETVNETVDEGQDVNPGVRRAYSLTSDTSTHDSNHGNCSAPMSPAFSKSLQDIFSQLDFLNDKNAVKISCSISSVSGDEVFVNGNVSFDTSVYNDSVDTSNSSLCEPGQLIDATTSHSQVRGVCSPNEVPRDLFSANHNTAAVPRDLSSANHNTAAVPRDLSSANHSPLPTTGNRTREVIVQSVVSKLPVVVQNTVPRDLLLANHRTAAVPRDLLSANPNTVDRSPDTPLGVPQVASSSSSTQHPAFIKKHFFEQDWTRSDTFDIMLVPDHSTTADSGEPTNAVETDPSPPPKPKRRLIRPLSWNNLDQSPEHVCKGGKTEEQVCKGGNTDGSSSFSNSCSCGSSGRSRSSFDYEIQYITPQLVDEQASDPANLTTNSSTVQNPVQLSWNDEDSVHVCYRGKTDSTVQLDACECEVIKGQVTPVNSLQSDPTPVNSPPPTEGQDFDLDTESQPTPV